MIYMDPPTALNSRVTSKTNETIKMLKIRQRPTREPEMIKAYRGHLEFRIHSYLTYLKERLIVSKNLLKERKYILQIGEENLHRVKLFWMRVFVRKLCLVIPFVRQEY